jgi:hypothetical protein
LEPGRFAILVIGDKYTRGELVPLGFYCMERMQRVGFRVKGIVVKNIQGNELGKGRDGNLWRYRALAGGYYIFRHEYVIVFQKPAFAADVRSELLKLKSLPPPDRLQDDEWDRASRHVYRVRELNALRRQTRRVAAEMGLPPKSFARYVVRRWYDLHTHQIALDAVLAHPSTRPEHDPFQHSVDFFLSVEKGREEGFDLELCPLPCEFDHGPDYARAHPVQLARWLYENRLGEARSHTANRLFVVLHHATDGGRTWELRRDFHRLEQAIHAFLDHPHLVEVTFTDHRGAERRAIAGIILCVGEQLVS